MKSILEELFYGNLCPNTDCRNYEQETKELMGDLSGHYDTLLNELNDKQKEVLEKFDDCYCELTDINEREIFVYAFQAWYEDSNRSVLYLLKLERHTMTGCIAQRNETYYVRLTYYDKNHKRKDNWVSTGLSGRGTKQKAAAMINSFIEKYSYLEKSEHPSKMADYLKMWKELQVREVAETTYDGYHTYIDRHLIPYFAALNIDIKT